jgi:amidohydrolase
MAEDKTKTCKHILATAYSLQPSLLAWRSHLHQHPELSFQEHETQQWLRKQLETLGLQATPIAGTGLWGILESDPPTPQAPVFWLRADIDALPIEEAEDKPLVSLSPGVMHACGHDVHTTCLLGALHLLKTLRIPWRGRIGYIFQPAEEVLPGGAEYIISEGLFERFQNLGIAALHVHPPLDVGRLGFAAGTYMASSDEIYITLSGPGGHAAAPNETPDTVLAAAHLVVNLQQVAARLAPPDVPTVLSFGRLEAAGATNVIPSTVKLAGTFRTMNENWRGHAHQHIRRITEHTAAAFDVQARCEIKRGYPVLVNHPPLTQALRRAMEQLLGPENISDLPIRMASEDFARYTHIMPGCLFRLGTGGPGSAYRHSVHTPRFDIHPDALTYGAAAMAWAALTALDTFG